ncbi:OmpA family protein [Paraburkholderia solisilvae]|uniref:Peptidoglycan-associated lipoprotein n=1 Tax=Paraburkholderia solisilvae TaxID=624376 RepID=A0A6J5DDF4_9BURK|nr:OmpA family protein [Paraburkholderia solisilvae]CAB3751457.1 Peptidoglycan-associated lipoprotein [Paraburkholderia solisilvae]
MLKLQAIVGAAAVMLAACTTTTPPVSHARPVEPQPAARVPAAGDAPMQAEHFTLRGDASFDTDSATLTASAARELDRLIEGTRRTTIDAILISGYTDASGSEAHNQELSERRALSVAQYLAAYGLKARRSVQVHGYGDANPMAPNTTAEGRAHNRRVEIVLETQKVKSQ